MYEIKILPNRRLTTPLFYTHALRLSWECEIGTAVEALCEIDPCARWSKHAKIAYTIQQIMQDLFERGRFANLPNRPCKSAKDQSC